MRCQSREVMSFDDNYKMTKDLIRIKESRISSSGVLYSAQNVGPQRCLITWSGSFLRPPTGALPRLEKNDLK